MKPYEILQNSEFYEPETLRYIFSDLSESELEQLLVLQAIKRNLAFWTDAFIFENVVLALNDVKPEIGVLQGCAPEQIWYASKIINKAFPNRKYSDEIKQYVRFMSNNQGVYIYPPEMFSDEENTLFERAKLISNKSILTEDSVEEIQAAKYAGIQVYIQFKETDELLKIAQDKKTEHDYYSPSNEDQEGGGTSGKGTKWSWSDDWSYKFPTTVGQKLMWDRTNYLFSDPQTTPTTISFWYKYNNNGASAPSTKHLVNFGYSCFIAYSITSNRIILNLKVGTSFQVVSALTNEAWVHLCYTGPVNSSGLLYINGTYAGSAAYGAWNTLNPELIGIGRNSATSNQANGNINDLAIWNRILSATEIATLSANKIDYRNNYLTYSGANDLVGYYLMGDSEAYTSAFPNNYIPNLVSPANNLIPDPTNYVITFERSVQ